MSPPLLTTNAFPPPRSPTNIVERLLQTEFAPETIARLLLEGVASPRNELLATINPPALIRSRLKEPPNQTSRSSFASHFEPIPEMVVTFEFAPTLTPMIPPKVLLSDAPLVTSNWQN